VLRFFSLSVFVLFVSGCGGPKLNNPGGHSQAIGGYAVEAVAHDAEEGSDTDGGQNDRVVEDQVKVEPVRSPKPYAERACRSVTRPAPSECSSEDFYARELSKCGAGYVAKFCKTVVNKNFETLTSEERFVARQISAQSCMALANNLTGKGVSGSDMLKTAFKQALSDSGETGKFFSDVWTHGEALYCSLSVAGYCSERTERVCD
jgi:hypothetical protein